MSKSKKSSKIYLSSAQIVTIILALLTFLGGVIGAYLQYFAPAKLAINSTRTAEAPTMPGTKTVEDQASPITASPDNEAWSSIVQVEPDLANYCLIALMFPSNIDPAIDPVKSTEEWNRQNESGLIDTWIKVPARNGKIVVKISGLPNNQSWTQLENEAQVSVSVDKNIPDHVNVIRDCAGGGEIRDFEPIPLDASNVTKYSLNVKYPDVDFFTLQPGEFEEFGFSFICKSPGAYGLNIELPFEYENNSGLVQLLSLTLLCPKTFTEWSALAGPPLINMRSYEWNGIDYVEVSK